MNLSAALARCALAWSVALGVVLLAAPSSADVNPPARHWVNPPAEFSTMAPAAVVPEYECYHVAEVAAGEVSANPPTNSRTIPDAVGGAVIGGVAGSYSHKFGIGAGIGALAGGLIGAFMDASDRAAWQHRNQVHADAYNKCMAARGQNT